MAPAYGLMVKASLGKTGLKSLSLAATLFPLRASDEAKGTPTSDPRGVVEEVALPTRRKYPAWGKRNMRGWNNGGLKI